MAKNNINTMATQDMALRLNSIELRVSALEQISQNYLRKKSEYTGEQLAAIRAWLLAGREAARRLRDDDDVKVISGNSSGGLGR